MTNPIPSVKDVQALNGRLHESLNQQELDVLNYYAEHGRQHNVAIAVLSVVDPAKLLASRSREEADEILKQANRRVTVIAGSQAEPALAAA